MGNISTTGPSGNRNKLIANKNYYVRADGNDSNDGLANNTAHAWLTVQHAFDHIKNIVDAAGYDITVNIADGTYTSAGRTLYISRLPYMGQLIFHGNTTHPENVIIESTGDSAITLKGYNEAKTPYNSTNGLHFEGFQLKSTTAHGFYSEGAAFTFSDIDFSTCGGCHIRARRGGVITSKGNYTISGNATSHIFAGSCGSFLNLDHVLTATAVGTPAFSSAFAYVEEWGNINITKTTWSGSAAGKRFYATSYGIISTGNSGLTYFPGNIAGEYVNGGVYDSATDIRFRLQATKNYYVRTDGNDANDGSANTAASAFLTIQKAIDSYQLLDCAGSDVNINVADGTYTGANTITSRVGGGGLNIIGNTGTPENVIINTTSANCFRIEGHPVNSSVVISGFKLITNTSGNCIYARSGSNVSIGNLEFSACAGNHIYIEYGARVGVFANYTISGNALKHIYASRSANFIQTSARTVTVSGTPAFSTAFASADALSNLLWFNATFSGSATGARYLSETNSVINTNGGGANYFPGNAGGTATTGLYV
jgi:hypothetical protein